jgi:hypothetical protein
VPNLIANMFFIAQLKQTCNIVEFWLDRFRFHDLKKGKLIFIGDILDLIDILYMLCDLTRPETELNALISHINE